jgi:hypothetical protein
MTDFKSNNKGRHGGHLVYGTQGGEITEDKPENPA